jgi:hypothetical protein
MKHIQASFQAAVEILVGEGPVKKRLCRAYEEHLIDFDESELPAGVRDDYRNLHAALHRAKPIGPQSCIQATVQKMSSADATRHAVTIFTMHLVLEGRQERSDPLRVTEPLQFAERAIAAAPRFLEKQG